MTRCLRQALRARGAVSTELGLLLGALVLAATVGLVVYGHAVSQKVGTAADQVRSVQQTSGSSGMPSGTNGNSNAHSSGN
jgi:uncharacterized protein (UPF0333 family)